MAFNVVVLRRGGDWVVPVIGADSVVTLGFSSAKGAMLGSSHSCSMSPDGGDCLGSRRKTPGVGLGWAARLIWARRLFG
jgi:hypothetical protein